MITVIPFSYISRGYMSIVSAIIITDGFGHFIGDNPRYPTPRVTIARI